MLRTLKHGQNRTSCVLDKRYAEQQCCRYSRQRRKFAPPGASQKKGTISEFPTKGYPPNLRVVVWDISAAEDVGTGCENSPLRERAAVAADGNGDGAAGNIVTGDKAGNTVAMKGRN